MDENNTSARNKFLYLSGLFMKKKKLLNAWGDVKNFVRVQNVL